MRSRRISTDQTDHPLGDVVRALLHERSARAYIARNYLAFWALAFSLFALAQPSFTIWWARPRARESGGTSSVTVVAAAT
jgi:hypothetical protein